MNVDSLSIKELTAKYNAAAHMQKKKSVKSFRDRPTALRRTKEILEVFENQNKDGGTDETPAKKAAPTAKVERVTAASRGRPTKRLTRRLCATIEKISEPPKNRRLKFWDKYTDGMTIRHIVETDGLDDTQVRYWIGLGHMAIHFPTDEEYTKAVEAFAK